MSYLLPDPQLASTKQLFDLSHVGMENIALPLLLDQHKVQGFASVSVNLPAQAQRRGIHMSRLYRLLNDLSDKPITPPQLINMMQHLLNSQPDSNQAQFCFEGDVYVTRSAMLTDNFGWKAYSIRITSSTPDKRIYLRVEVPYSSVCPCSTELSREILLEKWQFDFHKHAQLFQQEEVLNWLQSNAFIATPHNQRSIASVEVCVDKDANEFGISQLIDAIENALGTPVQTAVKRADEQAFAIANGQNLQFCEDAARKIMQSLQHYSEGHVKVVHQESLHAHNAIAEGSW